LEKCFKVLESNEKQGTIGKFRQVNEENTIEQDLCFRHLCSEDAIQLAECAGG
jgi:hypothetical protein